jgi:glycosyltransferase involved in cell wall biosynthesis
MVALARLGGPGATHIVLGETMASQLRMHTPEVASTFVLNNAGLVEESLATLAVRSRGEAIILGHLSNLSADKGLAQTLELASELKRRGQLGRMVVGGPANDDWTRAALANAKDVLGDMLDYRGPLHGVDKVQFFREIDVFVFPTSYRNEASPLVLLEAMSAGIPCLSVAIGCIADDLGGKGGYAFPAEIPFLQASLAVMDELFANYASYSQSAREQFLEMLEQHRQQVELLSKQMT